MFLSEKTALISLVKTGESRCFWGIGMKQKMHSHEMRDPLA